MRRGQGGGGLAPVCLRLAAQGASTVMALVDSRTPISELKHRVQRFNPRGLLRGPGMRLLLGLRLLQAQALKRCFQRKLVRTPEVSAATIVCLPCFAADVQGFAGEHSCLSAKKDTSLVHIRCKGNLTLPTVCLTL